MTLRHIMILASAGSGKTYALTNRFVSLLAAGAPPERIVALTFTRKAAGEFFDEILHKLGRAARDPGFAARLAADIEQPALGCADFLRLLRGVVDAMPRLRLGTLDGFFARIARAFPLELGLTGDFEVLQEHAARVERRRVLQRMFARSPDGLDAAQRDFIDAFKRATFGTEEKQLGGRLDGFLDEHQETFLAAPSPAPWGDPGRIWPDGCEWLEPGGPSVTDALASLRQSLERRGLPEKQFARWTLFFGALPEWRPGAPLPAPVEYILKNALAVWAGIRDGAAEMVVERKKLALGAVECAALAAILRHIVGGELMRRMESTRGIHAVLRSYDAVYHDAVRRSGRLTFSDVQRLLQPDVSGETLARFESDEVGGRLLIDFRLDAQFDHWLLDEFQDTSYGQWSVLRNLIDEAVQDASGQRSFFCVGDVKQAIYTWREGDPRLFREIYDHYNQSAPGTIVDQHLVQSFRSGPPVIAMVNAVFGQPLVLTELFPGTASAAWNREWRDHSSARPELGGHAAWLQAEDAAGRAALTVQLLHEIAPLERGLTCAVLTQTNAMATTLADVLRREGGIPAQAESDLHIATDNPLGAGLLALVKVAAYPGDRLAKEHVAMSPLQAVLEAEGIRDADTLTRRVLGRIHADGFERTMEFWARRLEAKLHPADAFSRGRARQFVAAAALFDATGERDVAAFIAFMERHAIRSVEGAGVVRVMTIHKSKGLGFDVVILPDLEGQRIDQRRSGLAVQRSADRTVEWILDLPPKLYTEPDATLSAHVEAAEAMAGYEALSLLYVAMTRAKRAMYVITKPVGTSASRNYPKLLAETIGAETQPIRIGAVTADGTWSAGDPDWYRALIPAQADPDGGNASKEHASDLVTAEPAVRRPARRPSAQAAGKTFAAQLFALDTGDAAEFGNVVHGLLAEVEWADTAAVGEWGRRGLPAEAVSEALACLRAPSLAGVWARTAGAEVWRERAFEVVLDGAWVAGVFDRVIVQRDERNAVHAVTVFDFKTDRVGDSAGVEEALCRHSAQLNLYRRAAAVCAGAPLEFVSGEIVLTRLQKRLLVPPA
ncbi:UvrD-helicase domain-containing protein [Horticoccus sp. 23ND18S-11]|uniref:UvrD-helicase domain-containing protein n=1 Tax=Horticoccus sp. 23ND18S-11 TaxID=3391832 RepID=UPI0039C918CB